MSKKRLIFILTFILLLPITIASSLIINTPIVATDEKLIFTVSPDAQGVLREYFIYHGNELKRRGNLPYPDNIGYTKETIAYIIPLDWETGVYTLFVYSYSINDYIQEDFEVTGLTTTTSTTTTSSTTTIPTTILNPVPGLYGSSQSCISVIDNGNPDDKIDVVFVPDGYMTEQDLDSFLSLILPLHIGEEYGILSREPFLSNKDRLNFYYLRESNNFSCGEYAACTSSEIIPTVTQNCPFFDQIIVLVNTYQYGGYAYPWNDFAVSYGGPPEATRFPPLVTSHEFGHSFGDLWDEYSDSRSGSQTQTLFPNCDIYGCPKWCDGTPTRPEPPWRECQEIKNEIDCDMHIGCGWSGSIESEFCSLNWTEWGDYSEELTCIEDTTCIHNCKGTDAFRSSLDSIMRSFSELLPQFNKVSKTQIDNLFRCCYPQDETEFDLSLCTEWNQNNNNWYSNCLPPTTTTTTIPIECIYSCDGDYLITICIDSTIRQQCSYGCSNNACNPEPTTTTTTIPEECKSNGEWCSTLNPDACCSGTCRWNWFFWNECITPTTTTTIPSCKAAGEWCSTLNPDACCSGTCKWNWFFGNKCE